MTERTTETIEIGKGVKYAKVSDRSMEFHKDNEQCAVETTCEFKDNFALFCAKVTTKKGTFTGHSLGKTGQQKAFEKLETIAVGRALAFAGYLASGAIATYEEMADIVTAAQLNSLKLKFSKVRADELKGLDKPQKLSRFQEWCAGVTGEHADFDEPQSWEQAWFKLCWRDLVGPDSDVPFEE